MAEDETTTTPSAPAAPLAPPAWFSGILRQPLSTVQTLVGIFAGLLSISGALFSVSGLMGPSAPPQQGEIVASVQDARWRKPVAQATVEILTPQDALVTTLNVEPDGRLTRRLKEGRYRLRVTHPGFITEVRHVEVHSGQRSDVRIALALKPPPPRVVKAATATDEPGPIQKFFTGLGFGQ